MRTAVVRVDVDPSARLSADQLHEGVTTLSAMVDEVGGRVADVDLSALPAGRRLVEILIDGDDADALRRAAVTLCERAFGAFGVVPSAGVLTYVSRGTDDDAHGVLAGLGLTGGIERTAGEEGWDIVRVTLRKADLERMPESRVHTALEASLNCEVHIVVT